MRMSVYARIITYLLACPDRVFGNLRSLFGFPRFFVVLNVYVNACTLWRHIFFSWEGICTYFFFVCLFSLSLCTGTSMCVCVCVCVYMRNRVIFGCVGLVHASMKTRICMRMNVCMFIPHSISPRFRGLPRGAEYMGMARM